MEVDCARLGQLMEALGEELESDELEILFEEVDLDNSGYIDFHEYIAMMRRRLLSDESMEKDIQSAFLLLDRDGNGKIHEEEIRDIVVDFCGMLEAHEVTEVLGWADTNQDGG